MGGVTCVTSEWRHEKPKCDSLVCLFFLPQKLHVPDGACARASQTTDVCRLWWVCVYVCVYIWVCKYVFICICVCMYVYVCLCVLPLRFGGSLFPAAEQSLFWWIPRRKKTWRQNLSHEAGPFLNLFLLCLRLKLLPLISPCFLCWAWLFLSHHFWFINN